MPAGLLVAARNLPKTKYRKGDVVAVLPDGALFGAREGLPNFVQLTVSDATQPQAQAYLDHWRQAYDYTIDAENAEGYRATLRVDPASLAISGVNKEVKLEIKTYVLTGGDQGLTVELHDQGFDFLTVDIAKPADLPAFKREINDRFEETLSFSRYYFRFDDIDDVVSGGGTITRTKAQVLGLIQDKLAEAFLIVDQRSLSATSAITLTGGIPMVLLKASVQSISERTDNITVTV